MNPAEKIPTAPAVIFWELTRRCELSCLHCRTKKTSFEREMPAEAAMRLADQVAEMGVRTLVLTGGEPILHQRWDAIAKRVARAGCKVRLFISGFGFHRDLMAKALDSGVTEFAVSLDGPRAVHDRLRPVSGSPAGSSYDAAATALRLLVWRGCAARAVTAVNHLNAPHLDELYETVKELGLERWQVHLCQNHGRAREHAKWLMCDQGVVEEVVSVLLRAASEKTVLAPMHCTVGYMTEEEPVLRNRETKGAPVWRGCRGGIASLAVTAEGGVKGCVALPDDFATASLLDTGLESIWRDDSAFPHARQWTGDVLTGACASCAFAQTCRAGCPAVAYGATGTVGLNPYCLRILRRRRR